jgi:hypothetical protein
LNAANKLLGAAIYADPLCLDGTTSGIATEMPIANNAEVTGTASALAWGNCLMVATANTVVAAVLTPTSEAPSGARGYVNAVEIAWLVPFTIPNDRTESLVTCRLGVEDLDLLNIHAGSVMSTGFGGSNCWYYGSDATKAEEKLLICRGGIGMAPGTF